MSFARFPLRDNGTARQWFAGVLALAIVIALCGCERQSQSETVPPDSPKPSIPPNAVAASAVSKAAELVSQLASVNVTNGLVSAARAAEWKATQTALEQEGDSAVLAIRDFLARNLDVDFEPGGNSRLLGAPSLRTALLQSLEKIGGANAVALAAATLQTTADPAELAMLIRFLDRVEPQQHRAAAVAAARETLAIAATPQWDGRDVAPLFEIIKMFGGAEAAGELEKYANTWFDYVPITLAALPNGDGVPTLIRLAKNEDGRLTVGLEMYQCMLAQAAGENTNAAQALIELTRANRIQEVAWPAIGHALAGNRMLLAKPLLDAPSPVASRPDTRKYHVAVGNQNFLETMPPETMERDEVGGRIRLITQLLEATTNPAAIDALEGAQLSLEPRLTEPK